KPLKLEEENPATGLALSSPYLARAFKSHSLDSMTRYDPKELKDLSEDLNAVPCGQLSAERVFSMCNNCSNKCERILDQNFEKRILYVINSSRL
ncbi:hypothetical protein Ciccas_011755, partial [Cichlidogyrus casuarinus]